MYLNHFFQPCAALQPYIAAIYVLQSSEPLCLCVLPQPNFTLSFTYRGAVHLQGSGAAYRVPSAVINGNYDSYKRCYITENTGIIVVKFKTCAISSFFDLGGPGAIASAYRLDSLVGNEILQELENGLADAGSNRERVNLIELFLCNRLRTANQDMLVNDAARKIREANGNLKIGELCAALYISESQFEKRFRRAVGISAKKYASLVRIGALLNDRTDNNITNRAYEAGYFDQAHFIRDFKAYTGYTPLRFFKRRAAESSSFMPLGLIEPVHEVYA